MPDAAYFRKWRAAHPEYRAVQARLRAARRRVNGRGDRSAEYARRASRAVPMEPIPTLHHGHCIFDQAREIVGPQPGGLTVLLDPLWDDLVAEAVLALIEGTDPREAVRAYRARESAWKRVTGELTTVADRSTVTS